MTELEFTMMFFQNIGLMIILLVPVWYLAAWAATRRFNKEQEKRKGEENE